MKKWRKVWKKEKKLKIMKFKTIRKSIERFYSFRILKINVTIVFPWNIVENIIS